MQRVPNIGVGAFFRFQWDSIRNLVSYNMHISMDKMPIYTASHSSFYDDKILTSINIKY